ncbi:hypothetical protein [Marinitoga sp. 38H-ov]|uniref:hypothetical protein n=1 Tax=Marinitoga sp. 38H-ov TaxID=1755814 RepID=UPI0013E9C153|nr:hypothetical protein [Marinitoga sp. 38H-ov]KAF2956885.1 hypothetical protein AS160_03560 [Marinitoga sp. 38H-ov]
MKIDKEERKKGAKSLIIIFAIMFFTYLLVWFVWSQYEELLNEFKVLPTLQIEKADWFNIYADTEIFESDKGETIIVNKIDETNYVIKYKDKVFKEKAFRYFNFRYVGDNVLISFPSFYIRGIKNILISDNDIYEFYKVPIDLQDEYDIYFSEFLLGDYNEISMNQLPDEIKNEIKNNNIKIKSKYVSFILDNIEKVYKISDDNYILLKESESFKEYYMIRNEDEKNFILRIFLVEKNI